MKVEDFQKKEGIEMYIYEIQSHEYGDFRHCILMHEKHFNEKEFEKIVRTCQQKAKPDEDDFDAYLSSNYPDDVIRTMVDEFGFVRCNHLTAHIGFDFDGPINISEGGLYHVHLP